LCLCLYKMAKRAAVYGPEDDYRDREKVHKADEYGISSDDVCHRRQKRY